MTWRAGIDENGLGPQLGPLIVTAVLAHVEPDGELALRDNPTSLLHARLTDSKVLVDHHDVTLGEAWARVVASRASGTVPSDPEALIDVLSLRGLSDLRRDCPPSAFPQCWSRAGAFRASPAQLAQAESDLHALRARGVDVLWARSEILCTRALNQERAAARSRLAVDLACMERLVLAARQRAGADLVATCGKVGGLRQYSQRFGPLSGLPLTVLREEPAESSYRLSGVGIVRFLRDADSGDPLVALASLLGKYVREELTKRIVRYYREQDPSLPDASGYNDPVTARFVAATAAARDNARLPATCFLRDQSTKPRP